MRVVKIALWALIVVLTSEVSANSNGDVRSSGKAVCLLRPTKGSRAQGTATFTAVDGGVQIVADLENLEPGKHGLHIHEYGDCSAPDGSSTGGHFNPTSKKHGGPHTLERHLGDLGNIVADEKGRGHYEALDKVIRLHGPNSIVGRSLVVSANSDDFSTQPTGNSGGKVACGVIE